MQSSSKRSERPVSSRLIGAAVCLLFAAGMMAAALQTVLGSAALAQNLMSRELWLGTIERLGGSVSATADLQLFADVGLGRLFLLTLVVFGASWFGGGMWIASRTRRPFAEALADWGLQGGLWWLVPGAWEVLRLIAVLGGLDRLDLLLTSLLPMGLAALLAGWLATLFALAQRPSEKREELPLADDFRVPRAVWLMAGVYVLVFTAMNWQLWRGLLIPHGDSAMYEEHLWNLTHGRGFRSYLDQGLFLGEHMQVVHVLLVPLHLVWPSHLLLELCESLALASGAVPVYWMARRHTGSVKAALLLAGAYLLYVPMHFLDIAIDLKTFRPNAFGIPLLLFALDQMERRRWKTMLALLAVSLTAQEDYAAVLAPLGLWIALRAPALVKNATDPLASSRISASPPLQGRARGGNAGSSGASNPPQPPFMKGGSTGDIKGGSTGDIDRGTTGVIDWGGTGVRLLGASIALVGVVYLLLAVTVFIPWFREGDQVHYAAYFGELGNTPRDIVASLFTQPAAVLGKLFSLRSLAYALLLLLPVGLLPLLSPGRLLVAGPWFAVLCLLELSSDPSRQSVEMLVPFHHFHAQVVPFVFWAAAAGLGRIGSGPFSSGQWPVASGQWPESREQEAGDRRQEAGRVWGTHFSWTAALATGVFFGFHPLSLAFWDSGSPAHWQERYVPGRRAELFPRVFEQIPKESRVASTDFIHPRFTHHERSYDYSHYRRRVSGYEERVPDDTDYIVIDTQHPYSDIKTAGQVRELREQPDEWELLPDVTDGYFIVLKRRK